MPTYTPVDPLPTAPSRQRPVTFATEADSFLGQLPAWGQQVSDIGVQAVIASIDAIAASEVAVATVNAVKWISGTTYAIGAVVWSPATYLSYRRKTAGAGTTDPSADTTNWERLASESKTYFARTSNVELAQANNGGVIDITSGTFTQTFASCASLRPGWSITLRNSGTGDITLDPFSTQTIDGMTSFVMYPGECRVIQCDGAALHSVVVNGFHKAFSASGTFVKPPGYSLFGFFLINGGSSGSKNSVGAIGGGGGGSFAGEVPVSSVAASETITVGAGGLPVTTDANGNLGGVSSFGSRAILKVAVSYSVGSGANVFTRISEEGQDAYSSGSSAGNGRVWGGGSGSSGIGCESVYGGGGGGGVQSSTGRSGGASAFSGGGGAGSSASSGSDGSVPGGGGGGTQTGAQSGAGARGEVRIWGML